MTTQLKNIKISNWKSGENRWDNPTSLQVEEALRCRNQQYITSGILQPRPGHERYSVSAGSEILGIKEFKLYGETYYIVIDKSGEINLFDPTGPTLISLETGLSTIDYSYWTFATLNDCYLVMTNGIDRPKLFDGNEVRDCGEMDFPIFLSTALTNAGTATVNYSVMVSFYDEDTGYESGLSNPTNVVQSTRDKPSLGLNLETQIITAPSRFTHYRIYRTRGDGLTYFFEKQVLITETSTTLVANDAELEELAPDDNAPMPSMPYLCASQGLLWCGGYIEYTEGTVTVVNGDTAISGASTSWTKAIIGKYITIDGDEANKYVVFGVDTDNQVLRTSPEYRGTGASGKSYKIYSEKYRAYHCDKNPAGLPLIENWPDDYFVEVKYDNSSGITGIGDLENGTAIFTDRSIYIPIPGEDGYQGAKKSKSSTGTCSHRSISKDGMGNLFFLSKHQLGVWMFNGETSENIGLHILPRLRELDQDKLQYACGIYQDEKYHLKVDTVTYTYDTQMKCWIENEGIQASSMALIDSNRLIGDEYGYLYKSGQGTNDGANLLAAVERTGTAESGGNSTLTDDERTWTADECKGLWVNIVSGTGVGQRRLIESNTADVLTVTEVWTTNPDETSVYAIGAIRYLRRFGWFTLADPLRTWTLAIHQEPQDDGTMSLVAYKQYSTAIRQFTESIDLTNAIDSVKLSIKGATMAFDIIQDNVDVEFKIYALILTMNQIINKTQIRTEGQQENADGQ